MDEDTNEISKILYTILIILICIVLGVYLGKKRSEGKHYNVALSHATKKLVRLIFAMEKSKQPYQPTV